MYKCNEHTWYTAIQLTAGSKKVKGGGALVYGKAPSALYALRGNNTLEFWKYYPVTLGEFGSELKQEVQGNSTFVIRHSSLSVAPNPFTSATAITYSLPRAVNISVKLYDVTGQLVTTLAKGYTLAGSHTALLDANKLARGIYLLKYENEGNTTTRKLIIE
jgi:hypothetical protein